MSQIKYGVTYLPTGAAFKGARVPVMATATQRWSTYSRKAAFAKAYENLSDENDARIVRLTSGWHTNKAPVGQDVLVLLESGSCRVGFVSALANQWTNMQGATFGSRVTHWRKLPKRPE